MVEPALVGFQIAFILPRRSLCRTRTRMVNRFCNPRCKSEFFTGCCLCHTTGHLSRLTVQEPCHAALVTAYYKWVKYVPR